MAAQKRDWSIRIFHEASLYHADFRDPDTGVTTSIPNSCIVTLTYNEDHVPEDGALRHTDFQRFMKRLRSARDGDLIRYFMCGEYGGKTRRPHFHAVLMGVSFDERYTITTKDGQVLSCAYELDKLWSQRLEGDRFVSSMGRATVEEFNYIGAAYAAGHVAKKQGERELGPFREFYDADTGEVSVKPIQPEYRKMSTGGEKRNGVKTRGLGHDWIVRRFNLVYEKDYCTIGKWKYRPPAYYDRLLREYRPDLVGQVLRGREEAMFEAAKEWDPKRCSDAEVVALANLQRRRDSL